MPKIRLSWQMFSLSVIVTVISIILISFYTASSIKSFYIERFEEELADETQLIKDEIIDYLYPFNINQLNKLVKEIDQKINRRLTVILPDGNVIADSRIKSEIMKNHKDRPEFIAAIGGTNSSSIRVSETLNTKMLYVASPIMKNKKVTAVIRTSIPLADVDKLLQEFYIKIAIAGVLMMFFAAVLSLIFSRKISRPLEILENSAKSFAKGNFNATLPNSRIKEIIGLTNAMNDMAVQLSGKISSTVKQKDEQEAIFSNLSEGIIALNKHKEIVKINNSAIKLLGINAVRQNKIKIDEISDNDDLKKLINLTFNDKKRHEKDIFIEKNSKTLKVYADYLPDRETSDIFAVIVLNDMTRIKHLENVRRDFVANVSHELKTPITAILGFVETLIDGAVKEPEEAEKFLEIIHKHSKRLSSIIEDLLSLSRLEQGLSKENDYFVNYSICQILNSALNICEPSAHNKNIRIEISCPENLNTEINPLLFEQAAVNLIDNAVKYSDEGKSVFIKAFENDAEIVIKFIDEGIGIPPEHTPRIFERFYRVDKQRSRKAGGTGLGLAIVKHIIQVHSGEISVSSEVGEGTVFTVILPKLKSK